MKPFIALLILITYLSSCAEQKKTIKGDTDFQRELNAEFKDASKSPLKDRDRKHFEGLNFFKFDEAYIVTATLDRTPETPYFNMKTTTSRVSQERIYGVVTFKLKGKIYKLNVYQGKDLMEKEGLEDYLFLPFLDKTNGEESYGGGRYIDARIPTGNTMEIDFNKAYNPYCAYNESYSCTIVPRENYLDIKVEAGVKVFDGH